jgi:hypothetical protein
MPPGNTVHPRHCTTVSSDGGGIFAKILQKLSKCKTEISMIDATHLKVHRMAASLKKGGLRPGILGARKEGSAASYMLFAMASEDR